MAITEHNVKEKLDEVLDPEMNIAITDLGLVYAVVVQGEKVSITMTLTSLGCPLFATIEQDIKNKLQELGVKQENITLTLTFEPPWSIEKMSERAKAMLGI